MVHIGLCEDDPAIRRVVSEALTLSGHQVTSAHDGGEALRLFAEDDSLDALVLDIGLPDSDGRDVCQALRSAGQSAPVIFLTALGAMHEKLAGFSAGADDYLTKPFDVKELVARVEAVMRRVSPPVADEDEAPPIEHGPLRIEPATRRVFLDGEELSLTQREFDLLAYLAARPGRVFSRDQLMEAVWEYPFFTDTSTVTVHIRRLRAKLGDDSAEPRFIETVWGVGYRFKA